MSKDADLVWCSPHPNHYHQYLLTCLRAGGIKVLPVYFQRVISKYPWQTSFSDDEAVFLEKRFLGIDWKFVFAFRNYRKCKKVVVAGWNEPTMILLLIMSIIGGRKFIVYSDTPKEYPRKGLIQFFRRLFLKVVLHKAQYVMSTGKPGVDAFLKFGVPKSKTINFPFLTNLEYFKPNDFRVISRIPRIFSSGRLDISHKGYDLVLYALHKLKSDGFCFTYRIAGEGKDRSIIEELIDKLNLSEHVVLLGWLEPTDLLVELQHAELFLHAARVDPYPNAVLEAMACGLPVLCSDRSGSGVDRITFGYNGYLFRSGDVNDMVDKLRILFTMSSSDLARLRLNARKTAKKWDYHYHVGLMRDLLRDKVLQ